MSASVAMVTLVTGRIPTGVLQSVKGQARIARAAGVPLDYFIVNGEDEGEDEGLRLSRYDRSLLGRRSDRWLKARCLRSVRAVCDYDVLLLRYPTGLDLDPLALFRGVRQRVATVHHTKELEEQLSSGNAASRYTRWAFEQLNGRRILSRVSGIVGVTDEIRDYEVARAGAQKSAVTVANGIDVSRVPKTGFVPFDGKRLRLLFVASDPSPWHGVDRLIASVAAYRGAVKVTVDVVGSQGRAAGTSEAAGTHDVHFHGTLRGAALDEIAAKANLAVATLGLARKNLRQACSLKTREYVARGLPVVLGYDDVDLPMDLPTVHRVPNSEALLDVDQLVDFAARMTGRGDVAGELRRFAEERLDWSHKLTRLVEFAQSLS